MKLKAGMKIEVNGLPRLKGALRQEVSEIIEAAGADTKALALIKIRQSPATGRVYKRGNSTHQASAPGEPPATDLGALANSIQSEMVGDLTSVVSVSAEYGAVLEFGGAHVEPRPYMEPSVQEILPQFQANMSRAVGKAVQASATKYVPKKSK